MALSEAWRGWRMRGDEWLAARSDTRPVMLIDDNHRPIDRYAEVTAAERAGLSAAILPWRRN